MQDVFNGGEDKHFTVMRQRAKNVTSLRIWMSFESSLGHQSSSSMILITVSAGIIPSKRKDFLFVPELKNINVGNPSICQNIVFN